MCAYSEFSGAFACENLEMLTEVPRRQWSVAGYVQSEFCVTKSTARTMRVGVDHEMALPNSCAPERLRAALGALSLPGEERRVLLVGKSNEIYLSKRSRRVDGKQGNQRQRSKVRRSSREQRMKFDINPAASNHPFAKSVRDSSWRLKVVVGDASDRLVSSEV